MTQNPMPERLAAVHSRIAQACRQFDRPACQVHLLAVSKTKPVSMIEAAYQAGQRHFGENYLQEGLDKIRALPVADITWHYIGAIQSNKTRAIAEHFAYVHTVASSKVARRLSDQRPDHLPPLKVLVQVNISGETSKAGVSPGETLDLVGTILHYPGLEICGLMAIPAPDPDFDRQRHAFHRLRGLRDEIRTQLSDVPASFDDLSMGMTDDLEAAIAEGATWLRVGTAIFGPRQEGV